MKVCLVEAMALLLVKSAFGNTIAAICLVAPSILSVPDPEKRAEYVNVPFAPGISRKLILEDWRSKVLVTRMHPKSLADPPERSMVSR